MKNLSRRAFLKGCAASAVGLGALSAAGAVLAQERAPETIGAEPLIAELNPQDESYDSYSGDVSALFTPIKVGTMILRNRFAKSAAGSDTGSRTENIITQNTLDYYGRMAEGGTALIVLESGILRNLGFNPSMPVENADALAELAKPLAARVHEAGAYIGYQISGPGGLDGNPVNTITVEEIKAYLEEVKKCTLRLKGAGYDFVEIKGATTDGLNAFLSRRENMREDEYGPQSIENRARFFVEMIRAVKESCGEDFNVLTLINAVEENDRELGKNDKYLSVEETREIAKLLEAAGADLVQVRVGASGKEANCWALEMSHCAYKANGMTGYGTMFDFDSHYGGVLDGAHSGIGAFIPAAKAIKEVVSVPVGCANCMDPRLAPDMMNRAVKEGDVDILFITRALTVDPQLPNKLQAGLREEIAPCTHCFHCHGNLDNGARRFTECCRVNATTQNAYKDAMPEGYEPLPAQAVKDVMVVGGGPAGMEAARVAAERGHRVTLYEASAFLGGLLPFAGAVKGSHERLEDLRSYLALQLERKGVRVVTEQRVDADFIRTENPDAVVIAVGGLRKNLYGGASNVVAVEDLFASAVGDKVLILGAGAQAIDTALYLLAHGKRVDMVNERSAEEIDREQSAWFREYILPHLYAKGVKIYSSASVKEVLEDGVLITTDVGLEKAVQCDTVIECHDMLPNTELFEAIKDSFEAYNVGDSALPFNIQQAIYTANITARAL